MIHRPTEARNPATIDLDLLPTGAVVDLILAEDAVAVSVARQSSEAIGRAVLETAARLTAGGSLHYFGAGASGRLAVLDATELTPTYGVARDLVTAHFPGGVDALVDSTLDFEDAERLGEQDTSGISEADVVFGVTASGTTPYVSGALDSAARRGALRILLTCNPAPSIDSDLLIVLDTGSEAITGSTRLKAGTATKVALNAFSSALMINMGRTYSHFMTGMSVTNDKLRERAVQLIAEAADVTVSEARRTYEDADRDTEVALTSLLTGASIADCRAALDRTNSVRRAVAEIAGAR